MRIKKTLKIVGISLALILTLLLLFVTAFIFNPMEGEIADVREAVPRDIDFFVRKTNLSDDFSEFPEPAFWADFEASPAWGRMQQSGLAATLDRDAGIGAAVAELRKFTSELATNSGGWVEVLRDLIGSEVILAGKLVPPSFDRARWCAYTRVSWRVRAAWGLIGWGMVRDSAAEGGVMIEAAEDGTYTVKTGGQTFYIGRHLDCLMIANDAKLIPSSLELLASAAAGGDADTFGQSSSYRDGIESPQDDWFKQTGRPLNAVEFYARPDQVFSITSWDDNWPDARHKENMEERVLASFLNLRSWRFATGSLLFEEDAVSMLGRIELDRNKLTNFQKDFFEAESAPHEDWLRPFLGMVPEDLMVNGGSQGACAAAALRVNAADFLLEMYEALDDPSVIDEKLRATGRYTGTRDLIDKLRVVLLPRTGFVFMRARDLEIETFDPSPAPHLAWVFWIRRSQQEVLTDLRDFLSNNQEQLGFTRVTDLPLGNVNASCREFWTPHIPGTGSFALMIYGDFFILSNSGFLARDMINARLRSKSLLNTRKWTDFEKELPTRINGLVYLNGERLANVFGDYVRFVTEQSRSPDQSWMLANRSRIERAVFEKSYSQFGSVTRIPRNQEEAFNQEVVAAMNVEWARQRSQFTAGDRAVYGRLKAMAELLDTGYLQVELTQQAIEMTSSLVLNTR